MSPRGCRPSALRPTLSSGLPFAITETMQCLTCGGTSESFPRPRLIERPNEDSHGPRRDSRTRPVKTGTASSRYGRRPASNQRRSGRDDPNPPPCRSLMTIAWNGSKRNLKSNSMEGPRDGVPGKIRDPQPRPTQRRIDDVCVSVSHSICSIQSKKLTETSPDTAMVTAKRLLCGTNQGMACFVLKPCNEKWASKDRRRRDRVKIPCGP